MGNIIKDIRALPVRLLTFSMLLVCIGAISAYAQDTGFGGDQLRCYEECQEKCGLGVTEGRFKNCVSRNEDAFKKYCRGGTNHGHSNEDNIWYPNVGVGKKVLKCNGNPVYAPQVVGPYKSPQNLCSEYLSLIVHRDHQICLKTIPDCRLQC